MDTQPKDAAPPHQPAAAADAVGYDEYESEYNEYESEKKYDSGEAFEEDVSYEQAKKKRKKYKMQNNKPNFVPGMRSSVFAAEVIVEKSTFSRTRVRWRLISLFLQGSALRLNIISTLWQR